MQHNKFAINEIYLYKRFSLFILFFSIYLLYNDIKFKLVSISCIYANAQCIYAYEKAVKKSKLKTKMYTIMYKIVLYEQNIRCLTHLRPLTRVYSSKLQKFRTSLYLFLATSMPLPITNLYCTNRLPA